jgi:hypothetical protein
VEFFTDQRRNPEEAVEKWILLKVWTLHEIHRIPELLHKNQRNHYEKHSTVFRKPVECFAGTPC